MYYINFSFNLVYLKLLHYYLESKLAVSNLSAYGILAVGKFHISTAQWKICSFCS